MTECTKVLPNPVTAYTAPDQSLLATWMKTTQKVDSIANALRSGNLLSSLASIIQGLLTGTGKKSRACKRAALAIMNGGDLNADMNSV